MSVAEELVKLRELLETPRRVAIQNRVSAPEVLDPVPVELPVGMQGPPSMRELVQEYVRGAMSDYAEEHELGTFDEEDDFEPENEELLDLSGYEVVEFPMVDESAADDTATAAEPQPAEPGAPQEPAPEPEANPEKP